MYETAYKTNPENGNCIIEVALDDYVEFFHEWDNTSFKKRDIHPELAEFLDICSEDIPLKKGLEIHVCLDAARLFFPLRLDRIGQAVAGTG